MKHYAKISGDAVVEVIHLRDEIAIDEAFHPFIVQACVQCSEDVSQGWTYADDTFSPPPPQAINPPGPAITVSAIDTERDRRIAAGFVFEGVHYQSRDDDRENIAGAATDALAAKMAGAEVGDYKWQDGITDFVWRATDNTNQPMDAHTMFEFGRAALRHKQAHIVSGWVIKEMDPLPEDYADDQYWPA